MKTKTFECRLATEYRLVCQISRNQSEFSDYPNISTVSAVIFHDEMGAAGFFKGHIVHLFDLLEAGEDPFWACDAHSQQLTDLHCALLHKDKILHEASFGCDGDLFHLDRLQVMPGHRGKGLGLACCATIMTLVSNICGYAAMKPFPLQWENNVEGNEARFATDRKKLIAYYEPLSFVAAPGEDHEFYYRELNDKILGFDRSVWKKIKKTSLPSAPKDLEFTE